MIVMSHVGGGRATDGFGNRITSNKSSSMQCVALSFLHVKFHLDCFFSHDVHVLSITSNIYLINSFVFGFLWGFGLVCNLLVVSLVNKNLHVSIHFQK